jgi:hypothetical protein
MPKNRRKGAMKNRALRNKRYPNTPNRNTFKESLQKDLEQPIYCGFCGQKLATNGKGRKKRYCNDSCKQKSYRQRKKTNQKAITKTPSHIYRFVIHNCFSCDIKYGSDGCPHPKTNVLTNGDLPNDFVQLTKEGICHIKNSREV